MQRGATHNLLPVLPAGHRAASLLLALLLRR